MFQWIKCFNIIDIINIIRFSSPLLRSLFVEQIEKLWGKGGKKIPDFNIELPINYISPFIHMILPSNYYITNNIVILFPKF